MNLSLLDIYDHLGDMIIVSDADDNVIGMNERARNYLDRGPESSAINWETISKNNYKIAIGKPKPTQTHLYLESILASSPSNIYWLDKEGRTLGYNDQQIKYLGLNSRDEALGKTIFDVAALLGWDPEIPQKIRTHDLEVMNSRQPSISRETVVVNGEEKVYLGCKSPMFDETGEVIGILGISTDITEQARIEKDLQLAKEKAEAANKAKSQFIASISHDIRTPLTGIQGVASWLVDKAPVELRPEIQGLVSASQELLALLNNVISLAKLELGESITTEAFDLQALIYRLRDLFAPIAQQKNLALRVVYPDDVPRQFVSVPVLVQRTILNLISNALKFTKQGHVMISVTQNDDGATQVSVEDTGIGIPEHLCNEIFTSFNRVTPSYQGQYRGSGLGLSIARQFAEQLGGSISVKSQLGQGSQFLITLPLPLAQANVAMAAVAVDEEVQDQVRLLQPQQALSTEQDIEKNAATRHILLVEDNFLIQKGIAMLLNKLNCYVEVANNGAEAIALAGKNNYDLIFMDIGLQDQDGLAVTRQIRQSFPHHAQTPIIALTAHLETESRASCFAAGINDIIIKPLTLENARACLEQYDLTHCGHH